MMSHRSNTHICLAALLSLGLGFVALSCASTKVVTGAQAEKELARKEKRMEAARRRMERNKRLSTSQKLQYMLDSQAELDLTLSKGDKTTDEYVKIGDMSRFRDTIRVTGLNGEESFLMRAIKDDETGDMTANEVLDAAVVTVRFRNVAERHGKLNLQFDVRIPPTMQDSKWQLRLHPVMRILGQEEVLEPIYITGGDYRKAQIQGYVRYQHFLDGIVKDPMGFVDLEQLDRFLRRNCPKLYSLKNDEAYYTDEEFATIYGVTEREAVEHYTNRLLVRQNDRRIARKDKMYRKYVKVPIETVGLRLDSVTTKNNEFVYSYTQTIETRKDLRKVDIALAGDIYEQNKRIYTIPESEPLTYYIASLSSFADKTPRYMLQVIERHAEANAEFNLEFEPAKANIREDLADNANQIRLIKDNLRHVISNDSFILDSIVVTAYASPEGGERQNDIYCHQRSESVGRYFGAYMKHLQDSLRADKGLTIGLDGEFVHEEDEFVDVSFVSVIGGENWRALDNYVEMDKTLTEDDKEDYFKHSDIRSADAREAAFRQKPYYAHLYKELYPRTRTVNFNFRLHRKGMTKDTIQTHVLDSVYMAGVQALDDRDYETAVRILRPYQDYNAAVAFVAMDYNMSALAILEKLPVSAQSEYMLALITSRQGDDERAVNHYLRSVELEPQYKFRGNLDPEIKVLIDRYGLFLQEEEDELIY